ncbi:hypothetical protein, partial [Caballeronia temeraria]|uniref:hypothetical protein n=1 Tax=Caballeronia temeraria TaxID=1777137 RepID=UPI001ABFD29B
ASKGSNINASGHFHDDMNPRYFSNLLGECPLSEAHWLKSAGLVVTELVSEPGFHLHDRGLRLAPKKGAA